MCQRVLLVNAALYVFFEGKEIEARIKWWNPIQISRTVPLNVFVALLNKGLVAVRVLPPIWTETMIYTVYFINKLAVSSHSGAVLYCFWCSTPALGFPLDYLYVFGCAAYASLLETLRDGKLTPSGIVDMRVGYDLGSSLEEGICIQPGRGRRVHFFTGGCNSNC